MKEIKFRQPLFTIGVKKFICWLLGHDMEKVYEHNFGAIGSKFYVYNCKRCKAIDSKIDINYRDILNI